MQEVLQALDYLSIEGVSGFIWRFRNSLSDACNTD
jgi:hypothetical protein